MANRPTRVGLPLACAAASLLLTLAGCASLSTDPAPNTSPTGAFVTATPSAPPPLATATIKPAWPLAAFPIPRASELAAYTQQLRTAARQAAAQAQHGQAQRGWDIVLALEPADSEARAGYAHAAATLRAGAAERLARARAAQTRGDTDGAMRNYLEALSLEPDNVAAAESLRSLEHQRALRNKPLSFARSPGPMGSANETTPALKRPVARSTTADAAAVEAPTGRPSGAPAVELEHAALLAGQGDLEAAIALLTPLLQPEPVSAARAQARADRSADTKTAAGTKGPAMPPTTKAKGSGTGMAAPPSQLKDDSQAALRASLADFHCLLAERWADSNPAAARSALAQCLRLAPQHTSGKALQAKLAVS